MRFVNFLFPLILVSLPVYAGWPLQVFDDAFGGGRKRECDGKNEAHANNVAARDAIQRARDSQAEAVNQAAKRIEDAKEVEKDYLATLADLDELTKEIAAAASDRVLQDALFEGAIELAKQYVSMNAQTIGEWKESLKFALSRIEKDIRHRKTTIQKELATKGNGIFGWRKRYLGEVNEYKLERRAIRKTIALMIAMEQTLGSDQPLMNLANRKVDGRVLFDRMITIVGSLIEKTNRSLGMVQGKLHGLQEEKKSLDARLAAIDQELNQANAAVQNSYNNLCR